MKPLVSVIIPTHNRANFLDEALKSVYAQEGMGEHFEVEVIVVDDASSDATWEVVRRFPNVRYIRHETSRGGSAARNTGITVSAGSYVAFLDDDDVWLPYRLKFQLPVLQTSPDVGLVYSQQIVTFKDRISVYPDERSAPSGLVFREFLFNGFVTILSMLVRREALDKVGYFDESLPAWQDYDLLLRLAFYYPFMFVPGPIAIYRLSDQGTFLGAVSDDRSERALRKIVENALNLVPRTSVGYPQLSKEARARVGLRVADQLESLGQVEQMQAKVLKTLEEFPWVVGEKWARHWIASKACQLVRASESPIVAAQNFCVQARAAVDGHGLLKQWRIRLFLGDVWKRTAIDLATDPRRQNRSAGCAALRAILNNPTTLGRTLLRIMCRALFELRYKQSL